MVMHVYKRDGRKEPSKSIFLIELGLMLIQQLLLTRFVLFTSILVYLTDIPSPTDHGTSKLSSLVNHDSQADMQINKLSYGLDPNFVEPAQITMKVVQGCHNNVTTVELDVSPDSSAF